MAVLAPLKLVLNAGTRDSPSPSVFTPGRFTNATPMLCVPAVTGTRTFMSSSAFWR